MYRWPTARIDLLNGRVPQQSERNSPATGDVVAMPGQMVVCTNATAITVTLPADPKLADRVTVIRASTGGVTIDGNGETILGETTQTLALQCDAADLVYTTTGWLLT